MTVFKGYCILIKRNAKIMLLYLAIFVGIVIMIQMSFESKEGGQQFEATELQLAIIDEDDSALSEGLKVYLDEYHEIKELPNDKHVLQEELFYEDVQYIVTIKKGYSDKFELDGKKLSTTKVPGTYTSFYADQQINTYLNGVNVYLKSGYSIEESVEKILGDRKLKADVTLLDKNGNGGKLPGYTNLFVFLPYLFIAVLCYAMSTVVIAFREPEVKKRMLCSAVSANKQSGQAIIAFLLAGTGAWAICMLLPVVMYGKEFLTSGNLVYYLLNSYVCMLVALSLSFLVGIAARNTQIINNIVNVLALGLCFLGGVFVPTEMFGTGVLKVARLLPTFWYEEVNTILGDYATLSNQLQLDIWRGVGIQLAFAAACVSVAMAVSKFKERS